MAICPICNKEKIFLQMHHKFSQTKWAKKLYGMLIHDARNIQYACADCHVSHASLELIIWNELEFCSALGIKPRSKLNKGKYNEQI